MNKVLLISAVCRAVSFQERDKIAVDTRPELFEQGQGMMKGWLSENPNRTIRRKGHTTLVK